MRVEGGYNTDKIFYFTGILMSKKNIYKQHSKAMSSQILLLIVRKSKIKRRELY